MRVNKLTRLTKIVRALLCLYGKAGSGKTTSLLNLNWEEVLYVSTENGFKSLQSILQLIEDLYLKAKESTLDTVMENLKLERPSMSNQLANLYRNAVEQRMQKPDDYILEIDHIHIETMADVYSAGFITAFNDKQVFHGIDMSKKEIIIFDTLTAYSDLVVKERSIANRNNSNKFATWGEHFSAITKLMDDMTLCRGIKVLIGHEEYDKKTDTYALALQGESIKEIGKRFTAILYVGTLTDKETQEHNRVIISNKDAYEFKTDAKCQESKINEIEPLDLSVIINKLRN